MKNIDRKVAYDGGQLYRVEHQPVDGRELPYEFVRRIGATTVLPITVLNDVQTVIGIHNKRAYYGMSLNLPGGNAEGGFARPEHPRDTGLREMREEIGYGYLPGMAHNVDTFELRPVNNSLDYPRHFAIARGVGYMGGEVNSAHEVVDLRYVPLSEYAEYMFEMRCREVFPEVNLAVVKAVHDVGHDETLDWLSNGSASAYADAVTSSFDPWMRPVV